MAKWFKYLIIVILLIILAYIPVTSSIYYHDSAISSDGFDNVHHVTSYGLGSISIEGDVAYVEHRGQEGDYAGFVYSNSFDSNDYGYVRFDMISNSETIRCTNLRLSGSGNYNYADSYRICPTIESQKTDWIPLYENYTTFLFIPYGTDRIDMNVSNFQYILSSGESCYDNIENGNELGVDCGGICPDVCQLTAGGSVYDFPDLNTEMPEGYVGSSFLDNVKENVVRFLKQFYFGINKIIDKK